MPRKRSYAIAEDGLACLTVVAILWYLITRAISTFWVGDYTLMVAVMAMSGILVWLCFMLWFSRLVPITATLAFLLYTSSRLVKLGVSGASWVERKSFWVHNGPWTVAEILAVLAFALLTFAFWRTHELPKPALAVFLFYLAVSVARIALVDVVDLGTYTGLNLLRNLSGGLCYGYLAVYFLVEYRTARDAARSRVKLVK